MKEKHFTRKLIKTNMDNSTAEIFQRVLQFKCESKCLHKYLYGIDGFYTFGSFKENETTDREFWLCCIQSDPLFCLPCPSMWRPNELRRIAQRFDVAQYSLSFKIYWNVINNNEYAILRRMKPHYIVQRQTLFLLSLKSKDAQDNFIRKTTNGFCH